MQSLCVVVSALLLIIGPAVHAPVQDRSAGLAGEVVFLPSISDQAPVEIVASTLWPAPTRPWYLISGYLRNTTTVPIYDVVLDVELYNEQGTLLYSYQERAEQPVTFPGELNPFFFMAGPAFLEPRPRYQLTVAGWSAVSPVEYRPLTVLSAEPLICNNYCTVEGEIRNDYAQSLRDIQVVVFLLDEPHQAGGTFLSSTSLAPGATATYTSTTFANNGCDFDLPPCRVAVQALGIVVP